MAICADVDAVFPLQECRGLELKTAPFSLDSPCPAQAGEEGDGRAKTPLLSGCEETGGFGEPGKEQFSQASLRGRRCSRSLIQTWHLPVPGASHRNVPPLQMALLSPPGGWIGLSSDSLSAQVRPLGPRAGAPSIPCFSPGSSSSPVLCLSCGVTSSASEPGDCGFSLPLLNGPLLQVHGASPTSASLKMSDMLLTG